MSINPSVYVGGLAETADEQVLFEHFRDIGNIVSVRVCTDAQTGNSLKYGYVNFQNPADAERAIETKNITELRGTYIRVNRIERDPIKRRTGQGNIVIKHLPQSVDIPSLKDLFSKYGRITSLNIATNEDGTSRGYAHVQFESVEAAKAAVEEMNNAEVQDHAIQCEHYRADFQEERKRKFTNLFLKNIAGSVEENVLKAYFSQFGEVTSVAVRKTADGTPMHLACIAFRDHESAIQAQEAVNGKVINTLSKDGAELVMERFIPKTERKRARDEKRRQKMAEHAKYPNLYVKNFDEHVTSQELKEIFERCGDTKSVRVMVDPATNISRCFGFVSVKDQTVANRCLNELNGSTVLGSRPLYVNRAMKKDARRLAMEDRSRRQNMFSQQGMGMNRMNMPMGMINPMGRMQGMMNPMMGIPPMTMSQMNMPAMNRTPNINQNIMRQPQQQPQRPQMQAVPQQMPVVPQQQQPLSAMLSQMTPEQAKNMLGERLYSSIQRNHPAEAAKITGMLLEMDNAEILNLLESPQQLDAKVMEALDVLARHTQH